MVTILFTTPTLMIHHDVIALPSMFMYVVITTCHYCLVCRNVQAPTEALFLKGLTTRISD